MHFFPSEKKYEIYVENTFSRTFQPVTHYDQLEIKKWSEVHSECTGYTRLSNVKIQFVASGEIWVFFG